MKPLMAAKISIKRLVMVVPYVIIVHNEAEFFLFSSGFRRSIGERRLFYQFCLTVMTNQIKSIFTDRTSLNGQTRRPASISDCAITLFASALLPVDSRLQHHGAMAKVALAER